MPHNWVAYEAAKKITQELWELGALKPWAYDKTRGIIQIVLEDDFLVDVIQ